MAGNMENGTVLMLTWSRVVIILFFLGLSLLLVFIFLGVFVYFFLGVFISRAGSASARLRSDDEVTNELEIGSDDLNAFKLWSRISGDSTEHISDELRQDCDGDVVTSNELDWGTAYSSSSSSSSSGSSWNSSSVSCFLLRVDMVVKYVI